MIKLEECANAITDYAKRFNPASHKIWESPDNPTGRDLDWRDDVMVILKKYFPEADHDLPQV